MKYELAKALKEAGFPQKEEGFLWVQHYYMDNDANDEYKEHKSSSLDYVYSEECDHEEYGGRHEIICFAPTLSELIDACGDFPIMIHSTKYNYEENKKDNDDWIWYAGTSVDAHIGKGSTLDEAVAKLWLELNK